MAQTCCVTCGASLDVRPTRLAARVLTERAWSMACSASVLSAPGLSDKLDGACAVLGVQEEQALAGAKQKPGRKSNTHAGLSGSLLCKFLNTSRA